MQYTPHNYQAYCIQRVVEDPAVGLFLRPGLGKTVITLTAVNILKYFRWQVAKVLVVAPKTVAEATWSKEAAKWDHLQHLRISVVLGSASKRIKALNTPADVYIINRENVEWLVDYFKQAWPFDMVVLDESTSFKNPQSKRFKAMKRVRRFIKKMVLLTGTPSSKGLKEGNEYCYSPAEFSEILKQSANYHGGAIRLISCNTGAKGAVSAQQLADILGVEVLAPSKTVFVDMLGNMTIGDTPLTNDGKWITLEPKR